MVTTILKPRHIMIDIETMALTPDALVLSIGAMEFSLTAECPVFGDDILLVPDFMEQVSACRRIDQGTQTWWAKQPAEVSEHWRTPSSAWRRMTAVISDLQAFVANADTVWAKGPQFDLVILENLLASAGHKAPWAYNAARDVRTALYHCSAERRPGPFSDDVVVEMPHHPLSDCRVQIRQLWEAGVIL